MHNNEKMMTAEILSALVEEFRSELAKQGVFANTSIAFSGAEMRLQADIVLFGRVAKEVLTTSGTILAGEPKGEPEELEPITLTVEKRKAGRPRKEN